MLKSVVASRGPAKLVSILVQLPTWICLSDQPTAVLGSFASLLQLAMLLSYIKIQACRTLSSVLEPTSFCNNSSRLACRLYILYLPTLTFDDLEACHAFRLCKSSRLELEVFLEWCARAASSFAKLSSLADSEKEDRAIYLARL